MTSEDALFGECELLGSFQLDASLFNQQHLVLSTYLVLAKQRNSLLRHSPMALCSLPPGLPPVVEEPGPAVPERAIAMH
jgi:hypothetical protein